MARYNNNYNKKNRKFKPKKSYSKQMCEFARKMGAVDRGRQNKDSLVYQAYESGINKRSPRKPLF